MLEGIHEAQGAKDCKNAAYDGIGGRIMKLLYCLGIKAQVTIIKLGSDKKL